MIDLTPYQAFRQMLATTREAEATKERPKPISLAAIPRQLALTIVGDYAAETKRILPTGMLSALSHKVNPREILLVIDDVPTLAMYSDVPMFACWTWPGPPVGQALREVEENPDVPGLPHYPGLIDQPEYEMMKWINDASKQARALTFAKAANGSLPALLQMPEDWREFNEPGVCDDGLIHESLSDDSAIAFEQFKDSLKEKVGEIEYGLKSDDGYAFMLKNPDKDLLKLIKDHMADRFDAHIETRSDKASGMTMIHLSKKRILS